MSWPEGRGVGTLRWRDLPENFLVALDRKLEGLYGGTNQEEVFDSLALDKQQALLLIARRFLELNLWEAVRRIENLYGEGGVGMNFTAWPFIRSTLERRRDFTKRLARHGRKGGGFMERGAKLASLHLLYADGGARHWEVHFDLYNPWASPLHAWRHLVRERLRRELPDWRVIGRALGYFGDNVTASAGG